MDFENIEPWNMFTNDFVAADAEEILADDLLGAYKGITNTLTESHVKQEPEDVPEECEDIEAANQVEPAYITPEKSGIHHNSFAAADGGSGGVDGAGTNGDEENDDTIFNFGLEPQVSINETSSAMLSTNTFTPTSTATATLRKKEDKSDSNLANVQINFESAVVYICPACGSEFNAQDVWKRHMNSVHNFNTRRGLNFIQLDKLYHECMECHKRIAMHAMENLLKHKFTHLPYRCTKCKVCLRQYKYRQDLMVHLRMTHRDDLLAVAVSNYKSNQQQQVPLNNGKNWNAGFGSKRPPSSAHSSAAASLQSLEIKDIKENAIDIFENTNEDIEVKNELIEPDTNDDEMFEQSSNSFAPTSFLEDALSRSSSHASERRDVANTGADNEEELCEKYIQYICPQCATEYGKQSQWRQHIENIHDFGTRKGLNFKEVNMGKHAQCLDCHKVIQINVIRYLQLHKFSHLPHKSWLRCKLCFRSFVGHKEIFKHLMQQHRLSSDYADNEGDSQSANDFGAAGCRDDDDDDDDQLLMDSSFAGGGGGSSAPKADDPYEQHIDYLCPQCGKEYRDKKLWRKHIVVAHHLTNLQILNFKVINERQVMCLECEKVITNAYGIQNAQQHRITHMPYKSFIRCRLCVKAYTDRKGLVKHLKSVHRIGRGGVGGGARNDIPSTHSAFQTPPMRFGNGANKSRPAQRQAQKEIVRHANFTFEIQYLDEDDNDDDYAEAATGTDADSDSLLLPELCFGNSFDQLSTFKCADCGSLFPTKKALQKHTSEEHDVLDFNNLTPLSQSLKRPYSNTCTPTPSGGSRGGGNNGGVSNFAAGEDLSNDNGDDLLVPTGDEEVSFVTSQSGTADIERNFCYLCPACGLEYKTQIEWRRHINDTHNYDKRQYLNFRTIDKFRFQCIECNDIVSSSKLKGLQDHKFRHLPYKLYIKCLLCSTCYNHKPNMISHLRMRHNIIDTRTTSQASSERDYDFVASPRPVAILTASNSGGNSSNKPPGLKTVEDCISFHNAVDHETIVYFCPQCNEKFDSHVYWRKHIVDVHNLNSRDGLNFRQIDEHHYLCLQCYKRVTVTHTKGAIGQLQSHKFRHLPYKSFKCVRCNNEFVRKQMFFKHLNRATNLCDLSKMGDDANMSMMNDDKIVLPPPAKKRKSSAAEEDDDDSHNISDALILNQNSFVLICPQCGQEFESWRPWREHINIEHELNRRETLNFKKISPVLHKCLECGEHVNGKKLRDLQVHTFKHLPFGAYIQCRFCSAGYHYIRNMKSHLQQKHPNVVQKTDEYAKMEELQQFEESSLPNEDVAYGMADVETFDERQHQAMIGTASILQNALQVEAEEEEDEEEEGADDENGQEPENDDDYDEDDDDDDEGEEDDVEEEPPQQQTQRPAELEPDEQFLLG